MDTYYVDHISDDCYVVDFYGKRDLSGYYYDAKLDKFYKQCGERYKILHVLGTIGEGYIIMRDNNKQDFKFCIKKFKRIINKQVDYIESAQLPNLLEN